MKKLLTFVILTAALFIFVACGNDDYETTFEEPEIIDDVQEEVEEIYEDYVDGIDGADFVGTWGEEQDMMLLLSPDGTGYWINIFGDLEWVVDGDEFHALLPGDQVARFYFELDGDNLFLDSVISDNEFNFIRLSHEILEIEEHPLLSASLEEVFEAIIDALEAADETVYREVRSFFTEQEFIADLLGVDPEVVSEVISITIQRLDRYGNTLDRRYATEDIFSHWDFVYEEHEDNIRMRMFMRHYFDIEADMSGVTRENFDAIEIGMSLDEVSALLGSDGTVGVASANHEVRTWSRQFGGGTTVIISIYFIDGNVTTKAQVGW